MSIEIQNIVKNFGDFRALDNVSFKIESGELVALLGPSGSGKTTLLRIISGLEPADRGKILVNGEDVSETQVGDRKVGFVFQHYALFRHMTVFENVAFGLKVIPKKSRPSKHEIQKRVIELLRLVRLNGMARRFPSQLSGGQRQRVALARALAIQPKMLLLDEPFGALDAKVRKELRQWLRNLHDQLHMTSVFVTHDQEEALEVADRIVVMNEGRIEQIGTPDEVYNRPANPFVYNFLGSVNLFHCRFEDGKAYLGEMPIAGMPDDIPNQKSAKIYIRPHLLDIDLTPGDHALGGKVKLINAAGPIVRVEVISDSGDLIQVELSQERYHWLNFKKGDYVFLRPKEVKIFTDDYSI